ncbi:YggS family pyridoxal phosphate-dependent enzyme [Cryomorphaceae bacterium]|nr:YggS family pyridoxal phosphate-dependent enzyme [Cryomorphaceae bacterium]
MSFITENLERIKAGLPSHVTLVAVSKTKPNEAIEEAYGVGHRDFGENKVQELQVKGPALAKDILWHYIGHLQRNKVKYIAPFVHLVHGVDSLRLAEEINKRATQNDRVIDVLLQVHIAEESTKFGLSISELVELVESKSLHSLESLRIRGLMGMATFTSDQDQVRREFRSLKTAFDQIKTSFSACDTLSMGMSNDYQIAIEEGSTMVRIGTDIFGSRNT